MLLFFIGQYEIDGATKYCSFFLFFLLFPFLLLPSLPLLLLLFFEKFPVNSVRLAPYLFLVMRVVTRSTVFFVATPFVGGV